MLDGCRLGIPIFHVYGHNVSCQVQELNKNSCILQSCKNYHNVTMPFSCSSCILHECWRDVASLMVRPWKDSGLIFENLPEAQKKCGHHIELM